MAVFDDDAGNGRIIPFGKYKGQTLAALRQDRDYLDWAGAQDGIRQKYPWIFSVTINNGVEPAETPEHNRYQALFLDDAFAERLFDLVWPGYRESCAREITAHDAGIYEHEDRYAGPVRLEKVDVGFEVNGRDRDGLGRDRMYGPADVQINSWSRALRLEVKPTMGDDYPAVLRQMRGNKCNILYLVEYTGVGATLAQVKKMFATAGIRVVMHYDFHPF